MYVCTVCMHVCMYVCMWVVYVCTVCMLRNRSGAVYFFHNIIIMYRVHNNNVNACMYVCMYVGIE